MLSTWDEFAERRGLGPGAFYGSARSTIRESGSRGWSPTAMPSFNTLRPACGYRRRVWLVR